MLWCYTERIGDVALRERENAPPWMAGRCHVLGLRAVVAPIRR